MNTPSFWKKNSPTSGAALANSDSEPPRVEPDFSTEKYTVPSERRPRHRDRSGENPAIREVQDRVNEASSWVEPLREQMARVIVGQEQLVDRLIVGLISNGHILLEGVPGLAKTLALKTLAAAVGMNFHRIQFTPDMLPADIIGTMIYNPSEGTFSTKHGPVFRT